MCEVIDIGEQVQQVNNNMARCQYGHHEVDRANFSPFGLTGYPTCCRECRRVRKAKTKQNNPERYRLKNAKYMRDYRKRQTASDSSDSE